MGEGPKFHTSKLPETPFLLAKYIGKQDWTQLSMLANVPMSQTFSPELWVPVTLSDDFAKLGHTLDISRAGTCVKADYPSRTRPTSSRLASFRRLPDDDCLSHTTGGRYTRRCSDWVDLLFSIGPCTWVNILVSTFTADFNCRFLYRVRPAFLRYILTMAEIKIFWMLWAKRPSSKYHVISDQFVFQKPHTNG